MEIVIAPVSTVPWADASPTREGPALDKEPRPAMTLRHALLALVSGGPLTGYDAVKHFRTSVGHLWHAPDSQIYPELRRMLAEGLLEATEVPWGTKSATKTQYSLTDSGRAALAQWQYTPLSYALERDHAHLLAAYFEWGSRESAAERLREHIEFFTRAK